MNGARLTMHPGAGPDPASDIYPGVFYDVLPSARTLQPGHRDHPRQSAPPSAPGARRYDDLVSKRQVGARGAIIVTKVAYLAEVELVAATRDAGRISSRLTQDRSTRGPKESSSPRVPRRSNDMMAEWHLGQAPYHRQSRTNRARPVGPTCPASGCSPSCPVWRALITAASYTSAND